jgi:hypothetical protein
MFEYRGLRPLWPVIFFLPWLLVGVAYLLEAVLHRRFWTGPIHPVDGQSRIRWPIRIPRRLLVTSSERHQHL